MEVARTIKEAERLWKEASYDLLVLDVSLPDGSGFEFCRKVRQTSKVPIIFLTASDEETSIIMGLDMGGDDYITKPFKLGVLMSRINALLRRTKDAIRSLAGENSFTDHRGENKTNYSSYWVFRLAAYGFLAIISLITVLNIVNSISMSVSAKIKQYGAMRAVGMDSRQITRMIAAEASTYAVCGMIVGNIFGLLLHYFIYKKVIITHFGGT